jgi:hypothetical protein
MASKTASSAAAVSNAENAGKSKEKGGSIKPFPAKKFAGKIKSFGDALAYQKKLRDEWR